MGLILPGPPRLLEAQGTAMSEAWVGSETELYLRALSINAPSRRDLWSLRPFSPASIDAWSADSVGAHPWKSHFERVRGRSRFILLRPSASMTYNSTLPWGFNDGAVWQGKGLTGWASGGLAWNAGALSMRLEPTVFLAQNAPFDLLNTQPGKTIFADEMRPFDIDLPQRFGEGHYGRLDPGQSHIRIDVRGATAGISTENVAWGPALRNPLLLGSNAPGIPQLFLGTSTPLSTPVGRFQGRVMYGKLSESAWSPVAPDKRFGTGFIGAWSPLAGGLELGVARFYHKYWPSRLDRSTALAPFGSVFADPSLTAATADNQLGVVFGRVVSTSAGFEVFGEFGKNDRNNDLRDVIAEPDHNSAWSVGFLKTLGLPAAGSFWTVRGELLDGRVTSLQRVRGQSTFYDHDILAEGHTMLGQLLGSPLLERTGGAELSMDRWTARGREGLVLTARLLPIDLQEGSTASLARTQWALEMNSTRFMGRADLSYKAGILMDLNRTQGRDVRSLFTGLSWRGATTDPTH